MQFLKYATLVVLSLSLFSACKEDEDETVYGTFKLEFSNMVGDQPLALKTPPSTDYPYTTASGQQFNVTTFGYYVSKIILEGPNGERFEDEVSATASESKGYYQVLEGNSASKLITLENVPAGTYNKVTFNIGISEEGVQDGAAGGVLDPAAGAWFWSWNSGYIGLAIEGYAPDSPFPYTDFGGGFIYYDHAFATHIGGWKDLPADSTGAVNFVNNVKTIALNFGDEVKVDETLEPEAHIEVDLLEVLDGPPMDFSMMYSIHTPGLGEPFADHIPHAFSVDHVHQ